MIEFLPKDIESDIIDDEVEVDDGFEPDVINLNGVDPDTVPEDGVIK